MARVLPEGRRGLPCLADAPRRAAHARSGTAGGEVGCDCGRKVYHFSERLFGAVAPGRSRPPNGTPPGVGRPATRPHLGASGGGTISRPEQPSDDIDARYERVRFLGAEVERAPASELSVRVRLEAGGEEHVGETRGTGTGVVELRLAVEATLEALGAAVPQGPRLELVGVKSVHAFDADAVMVGLRTAGSDRGTRLLGCVPVGASSARAAATATLDAVNRILGRPYLEGD